MTETRDDADSFDAILAKVVAPDAQRSELPLGSMLVGRFRIERVLGAGGMGMVYAARDLTLARDVAIKVHHATGGGARLRREAIAMAQLAHPNVVPVFEVGEHDGQLFVVMEYVTGTTLRAWVGAQPRGWRDVLGLLAGVGEGLAAAHDAGLVHRDIKPENVLIGGDGRARVGDFGLARGVDSQDDARARRDADADAMLSPMTQTGAVLGTPAYMAPEQFTGAPVDARVDQFAFCVTAWEMLWGERPFAGATFGELEDAIANDRRRPPPPIPKIPNSVRAVLERGLAREPAARYPDMHALLAALHATTRRRRRWLAIVGAGGALAIAATTWLAMRPARVSCDDVGHDEPLPRTIGDRLRALGDPDLARRATIAMTTLEHDYARLSEHACVQARIEHEWSVDLMQRSTACLRANMRASRRMLEAVVSSATFASRARSLLSLRELDRCANPIYLTTIPPLPTDPAQLDALLDARAELAVALHELEAFRVDLVTARLARLEASPMRATPEIAIGIELARGTLAIHAGKLDAGTKQIAEAYYAARALDDDELVARAIATLVETAADVRHDRAAAELWMRAGLADAQRFQSRTPWLSATIYVSAAKLADSDGDDKRALEWATRARTLVPTSRPIVAQALEVEGGVKMARGDIAAGDDAYTRAIALVSEVFGADSTEAGIMLSDYAASLLEVGRGEAALAAAQRAMKIFDAIDDDSDVIATARLNLGAALGGYAQYEAEGFKQLERARRSFVASYGEHSFPVAKVDTNLSMAALGAHDYAGAIRMLEEALAIHDDVLGKDHVETAAVLYNLAAARRLAGELAGAADAARRAIAIHAARDPGSDRHRTILGLAATIANDRGDARAALALTTESLAFPTPPQDPQTAAFVEFEQARALIALHRAADARPVLAAARATYAQLNMTARVEQIDKLAAALK